MTSVAPALQPADPAAGMDRFFEAVRRRTGRWYVEVVLVATFVAVLVQTNPVLNLSQEPYWNGRITGRYLTVVTVLTAITGPPVLGIIFSLRHAVLFDYVRGRPTDPAAVWESSTTRLPATVYGIAAVWALTMVGPAVVVIGRREHFTTLTYVETYLSHALVDFGAATFFLLIYERAFVGIAREVAPQLPPDFRGHAILSGVPRLIVLSTSITLTVGVQAAGLARAFSWDHRIGGVVLVTLGLVGTYVGCLVTLASSSVTLRVRRVADALNRVGSGGALTRLQPETGDELDRVGRAFNTMVELLEAHGEDLRSSRARLVDVADSTRRSIERDLHDGAQQSLALVSMQLGQLGRRCGDDVEAGAKVDALRDELISVARELRKVAHGIYPASLEAEGLASALRAMARSSGGPVDLQISIEERWSREVETAIYFAVWEAVQRAQHDDVLDRVTTVRVGADGANAVVDIGLVPDLPAEAAAELTVFLQDRLGAVGGTLAHVSAPGHGRYLGRVAAR